MSQDDFQRIRQHLGEYYKRHEIDMWLRTPNSMLNGERPCDLLLSGRADEVDRWIDAMAQSEVTISVLETVAHAIKSELVKRGLAYENDDTPDWVWVRLARVAIKAMKLNNSSVTSGFGT